MTIAEKFGKRIRQLRKEKGMSQEKLAEKSGLHNTYIGQIERGEKNASLESIQKLSEGLGVSVAEIFETFTESPRENPILNQIAEIVSLLPEKSANHLLKSIQELLNIKK